MLAIPSLSHALAGAALLLVIATPAMAQEKTCLLEGDFKIGAQRVLISDCAENRTMPPAEFREACKGMSEFTLAGETYTAKLSFSAACPPNPQRARAAWRRAASGAARAERTSTVPFRLSCAVLQPFWSGKPHPEPILLR